MYHIFFETSRLESHEQITYKGCFYAIVLLLQAHNLSMCMRCVYVHACMCLLALVVGAD